MKTIAAQEIKRRGISFLDKDLKDGPIHIIKNNHLQYVILTEAQYQEMLEFETIAYETRIKESLEDIKANRITHGTAKQLIKELGLDN